MPFLTLMVGIIIGQTVYSNRDTDQINEDIAPAIESQIVDFVPYEFDPSVPTENAEFYYLVADDPWEIREFDVTGDGANEQIFTTMIAMNHSPHVLKVVKDNMVIFESEGSNIRANELIDLDGFELLKTVDWVDDIIVEKSIYQYIDDNFELVSTIKIREID